MLLPVSYWAFLLGVELLVFVSFYASYKRLSTSNADIFHVERLRIKSILTAVFIILVSTAFVIQALWLWFHKAPNDNFFKQHCIFIVLTVFSILIEAGYRLVSFKIEKLRAC